MKALAVCDRGMIDIAQAELESFGLKVHYAGQTIIITEEITHKQFCDVLLYAQTISSWTIFLEKTNDQTDAFFARCAELSLPYLEGAASFAVRARGIELQEVVGLIGAQVKELSRLKVDLREPDVALYVLNELDTTFVCVDITQLDLARREYRIFCTKQALKSTIAACLLKLAHYTPKSVLLDPFFGMGSIPIEAALFASKTSHLKYVLSKLRFKELAFFKKDGYVENQLEQNLEPFTIYGTDQLGKHVDFAKKNAKIAGVLSCMNLRRVDPDWLDMKIEPNSISCVVSMPPFFSIHAGPRVGQLIRQCLTRLEEVLKKDATLVFITNDMLAFSDCVPNSYALAHSREIFQGKAVLSVLQYRYQSKAKR